MSTNNRKFYLKQGEVGLVLTATLKESNGTPVDLTGWTAQLTVTASNSEDPVMQGSMDVDADQVTNPGQLTYTFTAEDVAVSVGTYQIEIKITDQGGNVRKFPKLDKESFGTLALMDSKTD